MISAGAPGGLHTCALLDDDSVKCWGRNDYGQLGHGNTFSAATNVGEMGDNLRAVDLGPGRTAKMIDAGDYHTCALLDDDSVKCWGRNDYGQLGLGDTCEPRRRSRRDGRRPPGREPRHGAHR